MAIREDATTHPFWIDDKIAGTGLARIGVAESFIESLGIEGREIHIVAVELSPLGTKLDPGDSLGLVCLPDRAVDLRIPFPLIIENINQAVVRDPRLLRTSPYARGWLADISLSA